MSSPLRVEVLVSVGRNPASGRARRAPCDARAVELALRLAPAALGLVHAGDPREATLRDYLGMGKVRMVALECAPDDDPLPALIDYLTGSAAELVLAGRRAEGQEDSGLVPYLLAEALGRPLIDNVVEIRPTMRGIDFVQALPRGRRKTSRVSTACVATVGEAAPDPRLSAFAPGRRGVIEAVPGTRVHDRARAQWACAPARRRPRRIKRITGNAAERVRAATSVQADGRIVADVDSETAARIIYEALVAQGVIANRS